MILLHVIITEAEAEELAESTRQAVAEVCGHSRVTGSGSHALPPMTEELVLGGAAP